MFLPYYSTFQVWYMPLSGAETSYAVHVTLFSNRVATLPRAKPRTDAVGME